MTNRNLAILVAALALLVPAALALAVFPTAMVDTRELYAWGRFFPLTTLKHPPMATWAAGLTEWLLPANAFSAILIGQIVNAVGVLYLYATLRLMVDDDRARLFAFLYATSVYFLLAPLSYALNSDILQVTVWLAVVYHFARAAKTDSLGHWAAVGLWAASAVLTKYTAGLLFFAGAVATIVVPEYRRVWRNPRFWGAVALGVVLVVPHLLALRANSDAIAYAETFTVMTATLGGRIYGLAWFAAGALMFLAPGWIVITVGFLTGNCTRAARTSDPGADALHRFLIVLVLALLAASVVLALGLGTLFNHRYGAPFFGLFVLAGAPFVEVNRATWPRAERGVILTSALVAAIVFAAGVITYAVFTGHNYMQEPTEEAAAIVRADWDKTYSCGPGYIFGDRSSAHGLAIAGDRKAWGLPTTDIGRPAWYDAERLKEEGAIVAYRTPVPVDEIAKYLSGVALANQKSFTLPLLRTRSGDNLTYHYFFIPPRSCAIASTG